MTFHIVFRTNTAGCSSFSSKVNERLKYSYSWIFLCELWRGGVRGLWFCTEQLCPLNFLYKCCFRNSSKPAHVIIPALLLCKFGSLRKALPYMFTSPHGTCTLPLWILLTQLITSFFWLFFLMLSCSRLYLVAFCFFRKVFWSSRI